MKKKILLKIVDIVLYAILIWMFWFFWDIISPYFAIDKNKKSGVDENIIYEKTINVASKEDLNSYFYDQLDDYIELIKNNKNINVVGIYTHLSSADNDMEYTNKQLNIFHDALELLKKHFTFQYIHSEASNGLLNCKSNDTNTVRPGLVMYGYETFPGMKKIIPVEEIMVQLCDSLRDPDHLRNSGIAVSVIILGIPRDLDRF